MSKPIQKRAIATRVRLMDVAKDLIDQQGYEALRVDEVVKSAGVAKGTFFAHFKDKDRLLEQIIGEKLHRHLDAMDQREPPRTIDEVTDTLLPFLQIMGSERTVFDVAFRHSGAAAISDIGPIPLALERFEKLYMRWFDPAQNQALSVRTDVPPRLLADGVLAFVFQAIGLNFCAVSSSVPFRARMKEYLDAWLAPKGA